MRKRCGSAFLVLPILLVLLQVSTTVACQVCASPLLVASSLPEFYKKLPGSNGLSFAAFKTLVEKKPVLVAGVLVAHRVLVETHRLRQRSHPPFLVRSDETSSNSNTPDNDEKDAGEEKNKEGPDNMSAAMITSIGIYKKFISPLLPPACRFVPTCSQYGVQAITEFGPSKGAILTAWRLLRCSPFGGKGYDPPKWPPVPYTYSSY